ncbi:MAG TPA: hypothetical protein VK557_19970, partial [Pyrinomonadaceae bacterium]|nr:hypothetical protein [Pyrinomonadaceae bacterium]
MREIFPLVFGGSKSALVVLKLGTVSRPILIAIAALFVTAILLETPTNTFAQTGKPTPDKRDIGIQPNQQSNSPVDQTKSREAKPELVLQTGYNNFFGATRLAFSPDGRLLATATFHTNTIKLWETATGRELRDLSTGGQNTISQSPVFAFSPDSRLLAAAGGSNSVKVWDLITGSEVQTLSGGQASFMGSLGVNFLAFSSDGRKLVTISDAIRVWDTSSWREATTMQMVNLNPAAGLSRGGGGVALSPDGNQLARVDNDQIKFIDL